MESNMAPGRGQTTADLEREREGGLRKMQRIERDANLARGKLKAEISKV
jgi:hypothetical protein